MSVNDRCFIGAEIKEKHDFKSILLIDHEINGNGYTYVAILICLELCPFRPGRVLPGNKQNIQALYVVGNNSF